MEIIRIKPVLTKLLDNVVRRRGELKKKKKIHEENKDSALSTRID